jgi:DNA mismatch endonuclease (patch repair protein)
VKAARSVSYIGFQSSSDLASRVMRANTRVGGKAERALRAALWARGHRFRKHRQDLVGRPDIVFSRRRVVVFCDGDFWHGREWPQLRRKLRRRSNADYWIAKIRTNRTRDRRQTALLLAQGWSVIRIWETDVLDNLESAVARIELHLKAHTINI